MDIPLYSQITLNRDVPEHNLKRGDIATFIDTVPHPDGGEEGYVLEIFDEQGESKDVAIAPKSAISSLAATPKTYSDFTLERAIAKFQLKEIYAPLFLDLEAIPPSEFLTHSLERGQKIALSKGSEKAQSEFLIAPILLEVDSYYADRLAIYSGQNLDVSRDQGLVGECDFLLGKGPAGMTVRSPIITIVEAKRDDIESGVGQCVAQMIGAQRFNENNAVTVKSIFGCVTTGEIWKFLKLEGETLTVDRDRLYITEVGEILACFRHCLDQELG